MGIVTYSAKQGDFHSLTSKKTANCTDDVIFSRSSVQLKATLLWLNTTTASIVPTANIYSTYYVYSAISFSFAGNNKITDLNDNEFPRKPREAWTPQLQRKSLPVGVGRMDKKRKPKCIIQ